MADPSGMIGGGKFARGEREQRALHGGKQKKTVILRR